jgi:hypothetical protein
MGVPQGTVFGPTGFSVYDNDFELKVVLACLYLFADDSSAVVRGKDYPDVNFKSSVVNQNVIKFAEENFLRLNAQKTNVLQIHSAQTKQIEKLNVKINDEDVTISQAGKLLGVKITDTFNWKEHCDNITSKLRSTAYRFSMLRANVTIDSLLDVYYADVQSHILYTIVIWGGSPHVKQVFTAQKRCVRALSGKKYWRGHEALDTCKALFKEHKILTLYSLYILESAKFVKKYPEKFTKNSDHPEVRKIITRNKVYKENDLFVPLCRNANFVQNPLIMLSRIWNHLPDTVKSIASYEAFVVALKTLLLKCMFYDLQEFFSCDWNNYRDVI